MEVSDTMRQKSIDIEGLAHNAPIPCASRVGPILATSGVGGKDPATKKMPADLDAQARNCFQNLKTILAAGGCDLGDVVKLSVYVTDDNHREAVNKYWSEHYPDPHKRPARHSHVAALRGGMLVQLEALAVSKDLK
jgi:2-iminobutanoate/2-iminopropanoate deaminase